MYTKPLQILLSDNIYKKKYKEITDVLHFN